MKVSSVSKYIKYLGEICRSELMKSCIALRYSRGPLGAMTRAYRLVGISSVFWIEGTCELGLVTYLMKRCNSQLMNREIDSCPVRVLGFAGPRRGTTERAGRSTRHEQHMTRYGNLQRGIDGPTGLQDVVEGLLKTLFRAEVDNGKP